MKREIAKETDEGIVCDLCVLELGGEVQVPFDTEEQLYCHLEERHDLVIKRPGETQEQARARVQKKNSRIGGSECMCPNCILKRRGAIAG